MKLLNQTVKEAFGRALQAAFPSLSDLTPIVATSKYGDFQCNSALALWKKHGKELGLSSAKETADRVAEQLRKDAASLFSSVQVSPQGFITADVAAGWLQDDLVAFLEQQQQPLPPMRDEEKRKVIVDFSSPNVAKEMHVGHLRSTIIGESICRILEFRGHAVERVNHVGDWGTQFGMLIEYLHSEFPNYKDSMPDISDLNGFYKRAKANFDADEGFKRRSRDMVVKLQGGDPAALDSWRLICEISRKEFDKVYRRLGVQLEERGESTYNDVIPSVVRELTEKGMVSESDGAKCVFTSAGDVPLLLVKSDGGYGYDTTDLAAVRDRLVKREADWVIYVTDLGQEDHFMKVFAAATAAGWHQQPRTRLDHVGFGVVQGQDGKRFKTRSGETVKLVDLLDEATARALKELLRRKAEDAAAAAEDGKAEGAAQQGEAEGGCEGAAGAASRYTGEEHRGGSSRVAGGVKGAAAAAANSGRPERESANASATSAAPAAEEKRHEAAAAATKAPAAALSDARGKQTENSKREDGEAQQENPKERSDACMKNGLNETATAVEEATEEMRQAAEAIGYSAVKYFDLKQNRHTDYKFSYDRMLDPKGNTAVYMLYAYARICAIFRKAGIDPQLLDPKELQLVEPEERKLALLLAQFPDIVYAILDDLHIHRLAEYMYKVAGAFTEFYQTCKILGVPQQSSRLLLSECTRRILQTCFHLLGITPLQRL